MIDYLLRHRRWVLALLMAFVVFSIWGLTRLKIESYSSLQIPKTDPVLQANTILADRFGGIETVTFIVQAPNILDPKALEVVRKVSHEASTLPHATEEKNVFSLTHLQVLESTPTGVRTGPLLKSFPETPAEQEALKKKLLAHPFAVGTLVNKTFTAAIVSVAVGKRAYPDPSLSDDAVLKKMYDRIQEITTSLSDETHRVSASSALAVMYYNSQSLVPEMTAVGALGLFLLWLLFLIHTGSVRVTIFPSLVLLVTLFGTFGIAGAAGLQLTPITVYVVAVILAIGSSYPIHAIDSIRNAFHDQMSVKTSIRQAFFDYSKPLLTVALTSVLSGISLLVFDIADIRKMGVLQALGITIAFVLSFAFLPVLIFTFTRIRESMDFKPRETPLRGVIDRLIRMVSYLPMRFTALSFLLTGVVVGFSIWGATLITADLVVERSIPEGGPPRVGYEAILKEFGFLKNIVIAVEVPEGKKVTQAESYAQLRRFNRELHEIQGLQPLTSLTQLIDEFGASFEQKGDYTQDQLNQLITLFGKRKLSPILDSSERRTIIPAMMNTPSSKETAQVLKQIRDLSQKYQGNFKAYATGTPAVADTINRYIIDNKIQSILFCMGIIFSLLIIVGGSLKVGIIGLTPAAIAAVATFGLMGVAGISLDMATATITTIAIGVGVDFAIHVLFHFRDELQLILIFRKRLNDVATHEDYLDAIRSTFQKYGATIFFDVFSNVFGFSALLFSSVPILRTSGTLLMINQAIVIFTTFFVTPMLILILKPDRKGRTP